MNEAYDKCLHFAKIIIALKGDLSSKHIDIFSYNISYIFFNLICEIFLIYKIYFIRVKKTQRYKIYVTSKNTH